MLNNMKRYLISKLFCISTLLSLLFICIGVFDSGVTLNFSLKQILSHCFFVNAFTAYLSPKST